MQHDSLWLGLMPATRFDPISSFAYESVAEYQSHAVPFLANREADLGRAAELIAEDLFNLAQAFTVMFATDHDALLQRFLPESLYTVVKDVGPTIDHVGRELYGPVELYLAVLRSVAPSVDLVHMPRQQGGSTTTGGDAIFASVQVVEALRVLDPELPGVTIGKTTYAQDGSDGTGTLELFQPSLPDGTGAQPWTTTERRLTNLVSPQTAGVAEPPVCHLSIRAAEVETVHELHNVAKTDTTGLLKPYIDHVAVNTGDNSTVTKLLIRDSIDHPVYNKILEIAHQ